MRGKLFQFQTAFASSFGQTSMGLLNTWPSYTSGILSSNETTPLSAPMSEAEISLLGSLPSLGAMVGTALIGTLIDKLGRRNGGIAMSLPLVICWAVISATTSKTVVLAARFLGGVACGGLLAYASIFISEVAEDSIRGMLTSGPIVLYCAGTLLSYIFGWVLSYRVIVWVNVVFSVVLVLLLFSVKESPVYLLKQDRKEEARAAMAHYRGCSPSSMLVLDELSKLKQQLLPPVELVSTPGIKTYAEKDNQKQQEAEKEKLYAVNFVPEQQKKMSPIKLLFVSPTSRRAFSIVMVLISMQAMMGLIPVQVFAKDVFMQSDPAKADLYTVIFALVLTSGTLVTAVVADKAGRRVLIISSSVIVCLTMATLGYLAQSGVAPAWVTVFTIMLYCFSVMCGATTVPCLLLGELFVSEVQNLASMIVIEWLWFLNFVIIAVFPFMNNFWGIHGTFYFFACVALADAVISYFIVPETKGLSNAQIQELISRRTKK